MHIDDDRLLQFALEALPDENTAAEIAEHLRGCEECRGRLSVVRADVNTIGGIQPETSPLTRPFSRHRSPSWIRLLRVAAVFVAGIAIGWTGSQLQREEPSCISPAYLARQTVAESDYSLAAADATEVAPCNWRRTR